jgi:hypothetical protein
VRTDEQLGREVRACRHWKIDLFAGERLAPLQAVKDSQEGSPRFLAKSFSGHERNHLFLNGGGDRFTDVSGISGTDSDADGRAFALWDYDRDGWQDIALVNANAPLLHLFHNEIGHQNRDRPSAQMVAVRFVGGNQTAAPADFAPRDGYGAIVSVTVNGLSLMREHRCGEGFAAQNSDTMIIGIGEHNMVSELSVRWPSGKKSDKRNIAAGSLLTVYEDAAQSPDGTGFTVESYLRPGTSKF